jgi:PAS domain S-box-containing protein
MKRLFQSLSRTDDGAFIIDGRHRIIFWNQGAERVLGFTSEEVLGRQCFEILGGRDDQGRTLCQRFCLVALRAESGAVIPNMDVRAQTRGDKERWLNVTTFEYTLADSSIGKVIVHLFRDVTVKKEYRDFLDQLLSFSNKLQRDENLSHSLASLPANRDGSLTDRERQVLDLMARGLGTNEMADILAISQSTVRNHVQNILGKLEVHSRLEAIAYAYQNGLVEIDET